VYLRIEARREVTAGTIRREESAMQIRIRVGQIFALAVAVVLLGLVLAWVLFPLSLPYFENIWNLTGKPGPGVRAVAVPVLLLIIFGLALKRY
jgi:hypothetical protein